jgi:hypothetical protein
MSKTTWLLVLGLLLGGAAMVCGMVALAGSTSSSIAAQQNNMTANALQVRATTLNTDYARNADGPVWDLFDPQSQAVISRADFVDRHQHCPRPGVAPRITGISSGPNGYEIVNETLSGTVLHDYWHLVSGAWCFNLARSNLSAVALYRKPRARYFADLGCTK